LNPIKLDFPVEGCSETLFNYIFKTKKKDSALWEHIPCLESHLDSEIKSNQTAARQEKIAINVTAE
jgi:hypothetical protein